jgi:hypothetical protein
VQRLDSGVVEEPSDRPKQNQRGIQMTSLPSSHCEYSIVVTSSDRREPSPYLPLSLSPALSLADHSPCWNMTWACRGAGQEVGRSCHILKFKGKTIMLDCGVHPGLKGLESLP